MNDYEGPGLFFSPGFWVGAGLSLLLWTAIAAMVLA